MIKFGHRKSSALLLPTVYRIPSNRTPTSSKPPLAPLRDLWKIEPPSNRTPGGSIRENLKLKI